MKKLRQKTDSIRISYFGLLFLMLFFSFTITSNVSAQNKVVSWQQSANKVADKVYELVFSADIQSGWYLYSQYLESDEGPIPTSFNFDTSHQFELVGKTLEEGKKKEGYDELFEMNIVKYGNQVKFIQKVKLKDPTATVNGYIEFMTCDDEQCLPPTEEKFSFKLQ